jgi:hypothetical protein
VVYGEGTDDERVVRVPIKLRPVRTSRRFKADGSALASEEAK